MTTLERIILHACSQRQTFVKTTPPKTLLTLIAIVTGALQANAIIMSPIEISYGESNVEVSQPPNFQFVARDADRAVFPASDTKKFEAETHAAFSDPGGTGTADGLFTFKSNPDKTTFSGTYQLDASGTRLTASSTGTSINFTLLERTSYSITANLDAIVDRVFDPDEVPALVDMGITLFRLNPFVSVGLEFTRNRFFDTVHFEQAPLTGILEPGDYIFGFGTLVFVSGKERFTTIPTSGSFASSSAQFELSLDRLQGNNHVPDAGSTLGLLAFALGGLSLHRIRRLP